MNKKVAILALIVLPTLIFAQTSGKISGIVTDENGVALGGANVLLVGTSQGTATDADGQYYVLDVPVGDYSVRVQYIGYVTHTIDNVHVSADLTTWLDYRLTVAALEGEEVTVTAEKPIINLNATNTNRIIDAETIANLPIRNVQNLVNLQTGVVDGHVRGSRTGDNAYYVDGVLVRNQWNGGNITNGISRSGTQEISVQTGGFSAEYGSANGGVVNITSKSGGNTWSGSVEYVTDLGSTDGGTNKNGLYSFGY
ncbi:MAG: carboxypeptidase regulatory-like domain-containing protein, partial [Candidatus Marinimicrobia bacterium]|nr:carboxypeptidase regulatory-like domain-containing protein [Candidatus Neomarinimicrobiota bacterium]